MVSEEQLNKNPEIVNDETGQDIVKEQINMLKSDIKSYKKQIEDVKKSKENHKIQFELDKKIFDILSRKELYKKIEPTFEFEKLPEYWELQFEKNQFKIRENIHVGERQQKGYDEQLQMITDELNSKYKKLAELEAE